MIVMKSIEDWNLEKGDMRFDNLFSHLLAKKDVFITHTKLFYDISNANLSADDLSDLKDKLGKNTWYRYFEKHTKDIGSWIDFENKIEEVLLACGNVLPYISDLNESAKTVDALESTTESGNKFSQRNLQILKSFDFVQERKSMKNGGEFSTFYLNKEFSPNKHLKNGFDISLFLSHLLNGLNEFVGIFNVYLNKLIKTLIPLAHQINIDAEDWVRPSKIFSFNYTDTYSRIYRDTEVKIDYLHGVHGASQNIVLGVSDLEAPELIRLKAFGFTKYHQKLFKETDYLFLDSYKEEILFQEEQIAEQLISTNPVTRRNLRAANEKNRKLDINISIWGHSLDLSDQEYIKDIFSLNDDFDRNIRVIVYYYDDSAKFSLLNNLLAILDKDKVEKWMKKKWLQFKPNPQINFEVQQQQIA